MEKYFLNFDEPGATDNYIRAQQQFKTLQMVQTKDDIITSHTNLAKSTMTRFFMVIDADNEVRTGHFNNTDIYNVLTEDKVYIFRARNPVNDLEYGHGGIKVFSKKLFNQQINAVDMSTSFKNNIKIVDMLLSVHRFNSTPYHAWRTAVRECVKLASNTIIKDNVASSFELQKQKEETEHRLETWCNVANNEDYAELVLDGARFGRDFGIKNSNSIQDLRLVNDFKWLKNQFERRTNNEVGR